MMRYLRYANVNAFLLLAAWTIGGSYAVIAFVVCAVLYNLPRHSHHHRYASKQFWTLEPESEGPILPHGYLTIIRFALVSPLVKRRVKPLLNACGEHCASKGKRDILTRTRGIAIPRRAA